MRHTLVWMWQRGEVTAMTEEQLETEGRRKQERGDVDDLIFRGAPPQSASER